MVDRSLGARRGPGRDEGTDDLVEVPVTADPAGNGWWLEHPGLRIHAWQPGLAAHVGRRLQLVSRPDWWRVDDHGSIRLTGRVPYEEIVSSYAETTVAVVPSPNDQS